MAIRETDVDTVMKHANVIRVDGMCVTTCAHAEEKCFKNVPQQQQRF